MFRENVIMPEHLRNDVNVFGDEFAGKTISKRKQKKLAEDKRTSKIFEIVSSTLSTY